MVGEMGDNIYDRFRREEEALEARKIAEQRLREEGFRDGAQLANISYDIHHQYVSLVEAYEARRGFPLKFLGNVLEKSLDIVRNGEKELKRLEEKYPEYAQIFASFKQKPALANFHNYHKDLAEYVAQLESEQETKSSS